MVNSGYRSQPFLMGLILSLALLLTLTMQVQGSMMDDLSGYG